MNQNMCNCAVCFCQFTGYNFLQSPAWCSGYTNYNGLSYVMVKHATTACYIK